MIITYEVGNGLYINMTNRCSNACDFCVRSTVESYYGDLWLKQEPTVDEVLASVFQRDLSKYHEIVFCGYGEPGERIYDVLEVCRQLKEKTNLPIRINTNGQVNLICQRDVTPLFKGLLDCVSISLNAARAVDYQNLCHSQFGEEAYGAILDFAAKVKRWVPNVVLSVVDTTIPSEDLEICRQTAQKLGVHLRVRELIQKS
jgi:TatD family-associated radical SAM protein